MLTPVILHGSLLVTAAILKLKFYTDNFIQRSCEFPFGTFVDCLIQTPHLVKYEGGETSLSHSGAVEHFSLFYMTPRRFIYRNQSFEEAYYLQLQSTFPLDHTKDGGSTLFPNLDTELIYQFAWRRISEYMNIQNPV